MKLLSRWLAVVVLLFAPSVVVTAESVSNLPAPTGYVSDFAGVLSPSTKQSVENLCTQVDRQAHAQIALVIIKTLDNDQSIEEFSTELEDKWKVGAKGTDRGVLMVLVMSPRRGRIEVGYGLEGILNDARAGDILTSMVPYTRQGDYDSAVKLGIGSLARIITADAGVSLTPLQPDHQYHRQQQPVQLSFGDLLIGGGVILLLLFILVKSGNTGLIFFLLGNLLGGGGGRRYRGRDDDGFGGFGGGGGGGGFGGFGGGSSGGGGASRDM